MENSKYRDPVNVKVGEKIKFFRKKAGLTQEEVAEKIGLTQKHISRIEQGYHSALFITVASIAKAVGVPLDYLVADLGENFDDGAINAIVSELSGMSRKQLEMVRENIETVKKYKF